MTDKNTSDTADNFWAGAEILSTYLVADAVADGTMRVVDATTSVEAGFKIRVVMTTAAWTELVTWERDDTTQDEEGRLWDVLYMTQIAARAVRNDDSSILVTIGRVPNRAISGQLSRAEKPERVTFNAVVQAYDRSGAPCLTIFLPEER